MIGTSTGAVGLFTSADRTFLAKEASGNMQEILLGSVAMQRGQSDAVRRFGERLLTDHVDAFNALLPILAEAGIAPKLQQEEQQHVREFQTVNVGQFDTRFSHFMVQDHTMDISNYLQDLGQTVAPDVRAYDLTFLPMLANHYTIAQQLSALGTSSFLDAGSVARGGLFTTAPNSIDAA